ncbi:VWA domain-containing protein [Actinomadura sp. DC4]|uniref:vWA domain-containing protein n=1 Tax=Actinomadura sp. DC4 TaxID=3055069 RepID=UPI0025B01867|nr:VWA domain-containing protein [Actinomadura sp. DC4]MDN3358529.1 VWA domain-containing protein [Actinomadura sp. DC4]
MRGVLAADAQRAAGAPTAEPFTRAVRSHVPAPPLRVGSACDVSASMRPVCGPVASAAWILANATSHLPDAISATVVYGAGVRPITRPGRALAHVTEFEADDRAHAIGTAIDALEAALDLTRPDAARLLVIVSDGAYDLPDCDEAHKRITRLIGTGCGVLWLHPEADDPITPSAQPLLLTGPAQTTDASGQAAVHALRHT